MGPRSDERGNFDVPDEIVAAAMLQWGRVRMNAEMVIPVLVA